MPQRHCGVGRQHVDAPPRRCAGSDRGSVLLETALAVPLLMAVAVALAWGLSLAGTSAALGDAARTAARALARGEAPDDVLAQARGDAPAAEVTVEHGDGIVTVVLRQEVSAPVPVLDGLSVTIEQRVAVPREWM